MGASLPVSALALGSITPATSDNARVVAGVREGRENARTGFPNFLASRLELQALPSPPADEFTALQGRFERAGHRLYELHDGTLLASCCGSVRVLQGIGCARAFLSLIGGAQ